MKKFFIIFIIVRVALMIFSKSSDFEEEENIHIALIAPMTGDASPVSQAMHEGAALFIEQVNRRGGIDGKQVILDVYDDHNDPLKSHDIAVDVVGDGLALAVIGHASDEYSYSAGRVYSKYGIPAITPTATANYVTHGNEWYFRTIFSDLLQGKFLANYANRAYQKVILFSFLRKIIMGKL